MLTRWLLGGVNAHLKKKFGFSLWFVLGSIIFSAILSSGFCWIIGINTAIPENDGKYAVVFVVVFLLYWTAFAVRQRKAGLLKLPGDPITVSLDGQDLD